jgi:putative tryptophan/tyrosine transport system substrate-binding protein
MTGHVASLPSRIALHCAVVMLAGIIATPAFTSDGQPFGKWFKYSPDIDTMWDVTGDPVDPMRVVLRQKKAKGPLKRILVLYPRPSSAYDTAITEILRVFATKEINADIAVVNFQLDDARGRAALLNAEKSNDDLIIAMGSESTAWLYSNYRGRAIPVVTVCSKDPVQLGQMKDYESGSDNNFAFTSLNVPVEVQMAYVRELRPNLKNLAVLVDSKNISAVQTQAEPIAAYAKQRGVQVIWGSVQNPDNAREELTRIIPSAVSTMRKTDPDLSESLFWITGSTSVFREIRTINQYSDRVPVLSVVPEIVTKGADTAVLAIGISFESNAQLAAIYSARILDGVKPGTLKVGIVSPPDIAISFLKAREIGMRVPFNFFEIAGFIYDYQGRAVRTANKFESEPSQ